LQIDRPRFEPQSLKAYLIAGLIVAVATLLRLVLDPFVAGFPYVVFFPAVIVATFLCGSAAGTMAAALSVVSAWLFIFPPTTSFLPIYQTALFSVGAVTVVAVIGVMRAATSKVRRLNETLHVSEGKFRGLLESAPDAMVIIDEQRRIALINAQTETIFGYPRAELVGKPIAILLPDEHRETYAAQLTAFTASAGAASTDQVIDLDAVSKDGTTFPIAVSLGLLKTESGLLVSNAIRDMTARRQIEASLAEASKAKSDFLASVSHELRTPLNAIIGFSEIIRDALMGPLDARYRGYADDINGAGRHLQKIINDILDISKIESGHLELHEEIVSIGETVEACRRIVAAMADAAGVSLSINASNFLPLIRADHLRFQQILLNLMSNAVKFTPAGGRVSVSASIEADGAVIAVEDTGIGMKPEDIAIALEPFRQIDGSTSRRFEGTGLGLPLAKALIELHGGFLDIQSAPAIGTTVRIRLPLERIAAAAA
jgi:protein-histidine pros-kinase